MEQLDGDHFKGRSLAIPRLQERCDLDGGGNQLSGNRRADVIYSCLDCGLGNRFSGIALHQTINAGRLPAAAKTEWANS